jgi:filamentous hemagglutinin family protein
MIFTSAECLRARHCHRTRSLCLTVGLCASLLVLIAEGRCLAAAPITQSGLNTRVSDPIALPGGQTQYNITGGTRPGGGTNLFHSFGEFNVPTNNIANFLNDAGLPTSNILGRVTGGNASVIYGLIQTNGPGGFGNANLFLMNPAGFLFGPNATLNVGGMVAFTTADYLRFQGTETMFNNASTPQSLSPLSMAPVAAFGFLGNNPAAIAIEGSTLRVADGQSLSLVGGNKGFTATDPDNGNPIQVPDGITMTGGKLLAPGGQINIASVAGPGEISAVDFMPAPGMAMGNISLSQGALLDVSADAAGAVRIRSGQLVMDNATISANTGEQNGASVAIDINATGDVSLSSTQLSALTATASGAGNAGDIAISSGSLNASFGTESPFAPLIDSHTIGSGHGGNVAITTGPLNASGVGDGRNFIISGTGGAGNGGNVSITAGNAQFTDASIDTGATFFGGTGSGGNLSVKANSLIVNLGLWGTDSFGGKAGTIDLQSSAVIQMTDFFLSSVSLLGQNPVTIKADRFVLDRSFVTSGTAFADGGDFNVTARVVELSNGGLISVQALGDSKAGNVHITASERVTVSGTGEPTNPFSPTASGIYTSSIGVVGTQGNAGNITISTPRLELMNGGQVNSTTFTSGRGGDVIIQANNVSITGERPSDEGQVFFATGGTRASGVYTSTLGSDLCTGACGNAGNINITTGSLTLQTGGVLNSNTSNSGHGGNITVTASDQALISGTMIDGMPGGIFSQSNSTNTDAGAAGTISVTGGQSVTISNGAAISASSLGPGPTGNISINAGNQLGMSNGSVTTQADHSSGGTIKITTNPDGTVQLTDSTISASVLDGNGGGGSVNIDPQSVVLINSQILANAVFGPGGNINITTNLLLPDTTSVISASSQFGQQGTVIIQSPVSPASGRINPLGQKPLIQTSLVSQRCAVLAGGTASSFTVAGRDSLPTEPGEWVSTPLALSLSDYADGTVQGDQIDQTNETPLISLRKIAPSGFLTQSFAANSSEGCKS